MASKVWNCYNNQCRDKNGRRTHFGTIVNGELQIANMDNIQQINTDGASMVVVCKHCGRPCTWWPKDSDLVTATLRTHAFSALVKEIARKLIDVVFETMASRNVSEEIVDGLTDRLVEETRVKRAG